jgi:hypothetical protein
MNRVAEMSHACSAITAGFLVFICTACTQTDTERADYLKPEDKAMDTVIDGIRFEVGNWEEPSYEKALASLGNHRAVIKAPAGEDAVFLHLPWRRRDENPEDKRIVLVDAETGASIDNILVRSLNYEYVDIVFQTSEESEQYLVYYYPFETTGGYYPTVTYLKPETTAEDEWLNRCSHLDEADLATLPQASVEAIQAINDFHRFFPMEVVATQEEVDAFKAALPKPWYLFPEYRDNPTRMTKRLPYHWMKRGLKNGINDDVKRGEFYVLQAVAYAAERDLENLSIRYGDLVSENGARIPSDQFQCINLGGLDLHGNAFSKRVDVVKGKIQPLWIGVLVPEAAQPGQYAGVVEVKPENEESQTIHLSLRVSEELIPNRGDDDPAKLGRIRWLNSRLGSEDDFIIDPFTPIAVEGRSLKILGRSIQLGEEGLPHQIQSFFSEEMTGFQDEAEDILAGPIAFTVMANGEAQAWTTENFTIETQSMGRAVWNVQSESPDFSLQLNGLLEYDGMLHCELNLTAKAAIEVDDIRLTVPMERAAARYLLGLGYKGSQRPSQIDWKWEVTNHHEGLWLGNVNKGLQYVLRDDQYRRPLNTNFYQAQPLILPDAWYNDGNGGIRVGEKEGRIVCDNYSGPRQLKAGQTLNFQVRFLITPFKPIDTRTHFNTRFVHKYVPVDTVLNYGGTVVNVHHANEINPYINYPFYNLDAQKAYIDEAHRKGVKVKLYNTIRELTYKCYELFPFRSLGHEIFNDGEGGGHPWLQEHLEGDYHKAWHAWRVNDAAILNKGTSRWTNYYIEGLNWLAKNQKIDGLYLDDIAFSRETVKRMVAVLNRHRDEVVIDLHSANQFNERDGFINSAFLYMEHFPYVSRLWFGEYFEYDREPDYWLTEVSGLPFGLMGEMLQDGGHPYRGMVYGMTTRVYGQYNPEAIWKLFDEFGIQESDMVGYWVSSVPVKTDNPKVLATVYQKEDAVLVALGSWSDQDEVVDLQIDWSQLPFSGTEATTWVVPEVKDLQTGRILDSGKPFTVEKNQGLFVIIR